MSLVVAEATHYNNLQLTKDAHAVAKGHETAASNNPPENGEKTFGFI